MIACIVCQTCAAVAASSLGGIFLILRLYGQRLRHLVSRKKDRCKCCHDKS